MITLYGIKNCDTIKKARQWLKARGVDYVFHDYRVDGLDEKQLRRWVKELGWEALLNRRGLIWRKLPDKTKEGINETRAMALMLENPAIIKRPLLDVGKVRRLGFDEAEYRKLLEADK